MPTMFVPDALIRDLQSSAASPSTEDEMIWEPEGTTHDVHYLAIDTNVLIQHLNLVRTIHALLAELHPAPLLLLIPSIVIRELDGLKSSERKHSHHELITVGQLARAANAWLLETNRARRTTSKGAVRCQSLKERHDPEVRAAGSADDEILDCCLFFKDLGEITLWTEDKNLSLKAESEQIPTVGGKGITLQSILRGTDAPFPDDFWIKVARLGGDFASEDLQNGDQTFDDDVDMDAERNRKSLLSLTYPEERRGHDEETSQRRYPYLLQSTEDGYAFRPPTGLSSDIFQGHPHTSLPSLNTGNLQDSGSPLVSPLATTPNNANRTPPPSTTFKSTILDLKRATSSPATPQPVLSVQLLSSISHALLQPTLSLRALMPSSSTSPPSISSEKAIPILLTSLTSLDSQLAQSGHSPSTTIRQTLLRSLSAARTLNDYYECSQDPYAALKRGVRRPRLGEVGDALLILSESLSSLGVIAESEEEALRALAADVRGVP